MANFHIESEKGITTIRIQRGERYNALNSEMLAEFNHILGRVMQNTDQILVLTGDDNGFCAGGDITMMKQTADEAAFEKVMDDVEGIVSKLFLMPKIVLSAIHGPAAGLGLSIALTADYVLANQKAKIAMNFIGIGLIPDGGGHYWLEGRIGTHKAKQFIWDGLQLSAEEAFNQNIIDEVVETDVIVAARQRAEKLKLKPLKSMIATKQIYHQFEKEKLFQYLRQEKNKQLELRKSKDHQEGVEAFLSKRKPFFTGE
ncbi:enoyl-CoA hydratase [Terrihalobacillus insolitus]|uniref:enoyl-CoA hydratase n=1 Tax=Terrihalobacillus insolitus TaxID=2950438 RepID=UPI002340C842|nr:enoyl-CoA hydratase [Terrihalobacillus insolitus]MDC3413542.1 enoyl-CoA hydratase [Terrihalobacillus insolitus]